MIEFHRIFNQKLINALKILSAVIFCKLFEKIPARNFRLEFRLLRTPIIKRQKKYFRERKMQTV
jgi:hypothetical protein